MARLFYLAAGLFSLLLGAVGAFLPLLPTVPFVILAAFCFARSSPRLEARLLGHRSFGPHIRAWRERGAISRKGKIAALIGFCLSAATGFLLLDMPWSLAPLTVAVTGGIWIATRPDA